MITETTIPIKDISTAAELQPRVEMDEDLVADYAEEMENGAKFPPVIVFFDGKKYWLADGYHRYMAAGVLGKTEIETVVHEGSKRDAILHSVGANATHGQRRSNADKRRAVMAMLEDPEWVQWSDHEIARQCAVNQSTVSRIRSSLMQSDSEPQQRTYTTKHGTTAKMNTSKIGRKKKVEPDHDEFWAEEEEESPIVYTEAAEVVEIFQEYFEIHFAAADPMIRHEIVNSLIKLLREMSIKHNRESIHLHRGVG